MSFLSVVVATYNREQALKITLDRLADQTLDGDKYEILVVDDGSPDNTEQMVRRYMESSPCSIRYFRHENHGPGYTENRGIREAKGPWVLLMADDIQAQPQMLEAHYRMHDRHRETNIVVGGKVLQSPDLPDTVFHKNWDPFRYRSFENLNEFTYIHFWACNVSFKRDFMLEYGMFVERPGAAHEDVEVGWRLFKNGNMRILYCKEALGYHYHVEDIDKACRRAYERGLKIDTLADKIDDPCLYIRMHLLTRRTLPVIFKGYRKPGAYILPEDRSIIWFLLREALRQIIFNRLTIPLVAVPVIRNAEHSRLLAALVGKKLIRGAVSYYFLKGIRELRRKRRRDKNAGRLII